MTFRESRPGAGTRPPKTTSTSRARSTSWYPYLSGDITGRRLDAVGLMPLRLVEQGPWDPGEEDWGGEGQSRGAWVEAIVARGPRPAYEMERVIPGADPEEPERDPIVESVEAWEHGDVEGAREILGRLIEADLRCLDAHAHLGSLEYKYEYSAPEALRHHEVGVRIGELSLGAGFDGSFPGALSATAPSCAACTGTASASGASAVRARPGASSSACSW